MGATLTTADASLKEDYLPPWREQVNNANVLDAIVSKNTEDVEGRRAVLSLHVSRNNGGGARAENGTLPTAGNQGWAEQRVPVYYNYHRIQLSGPVIKASKSDKGSFARALEAEMTGAKNDASRNYNRQRWGTSNGVIATAGLTSTSTTVVLLNASPAQLRQLAGLRIDIGTVANPVSVAENRLVESIDTAAGTIVISGAAVSTTSGTDFLFSTGSGGAIGGVGQKELTGLQSIVDSTGTLFNVNPTTYPVWASYENSNSGTLRALTDTLMEQALDETYIASGEDPDVIITTNEVRRAYANSLKSQKRFANTIDLKGGFKALEVTAGRSTVGLTWDRDAVAGQAFGLNTKHLSDFIEEDWQFMDQDGAILSRVPDTDAYEATLYKYAEQATDRRNAHFKITDLAGS